ncbi:hypothetical protein HN51_057414 [Arachis hypogaea]
MDPTFITTVTQIRTFLFLRRITTTISVRFLFFSGMIRVTVVQCYRSLLQILTLAAVLPGSVRSALAEQTAVAVWLFLRIPVSNRNFARKRRETLLSRQRLWNWIGTITIEQIGFMNIMAFQRNRLRERVLFLESRRQNRAMIDFAFDDADAIEEGTLVAIIGRHIFPSTHSTYHSQASGPPGIGLRPLNSPNTVSSMGQYGQILQQYQQHQK